MNLENFERIKSHYAQYSALYDIQSTQLFKLVIYHKFISDDEYYKAWADVAFDEYLKILRDKPPSFEIVKALQQARDSYRII